jgi:hypothetical protein
MQSAYKLIILILFLVLSSCSINHNYVWDEYPITSNKILPQTSFKEGQEVRIIKGKSEDSNIFLGKVGAHKYYGSEQSLTDGIADQFANELRKKRIKIEAKAEKSFEITVNDTFFEKGMWKIAATADFTVRFGNGKVKVYSVRNSSPATVDRTYNGLVALSVIKIINDLEVLDYLNN